MSHSKPKPETQGSHCIECGPDVSVDEDGCCSTCGFDALWYRDGDCRCENYADQQRCPQCLHESVSLETVRRLTQERDEWKANAESFLGKVADLVFAKQAVEQERDEAKAELAGSDKERNLLVDALTLHMRSTGISDDAMQKVDEFRLVHEDAKRIYQTEFERLESGWDAAAKERDEAVKSNEILNGAFDRWQDRFCALLDAWSNGTNETCLAAMERFVKAKDDVAADAHAQELFALRDERDRLRDELAKVAADRDDAQKLHDDIAAWIATDEGE